VTPSEGGRDWRTWHTAYDDPGSRLAERLALVQHAIRSAFDSCPPGPIRVISLCAGEGRDLLGVLDDHPRAGDVRARLVELDPVLAGRARDRVAATGLTNIEVVTGDASHSGAYTGLVPADVVVVCGVFGNVADDDIVELVDALPMLCSPGATVVWTRHRRPPDRTVLIRDRLQANGFEEVSFAAPDGHVLTVGAHRYAGTPSKFHDDRRLFTFVGYDALR
jgi:hypothetical protein